MRISKAEIESQRAFRPLLQAMSRPGRVFALCLAMNRHKPWFAFLELIESLLDQEVSFTVIGSDVSRQLESLIEDRTRSRTAPSSEADFLVIADGDSRGKVLEAKRGTLQYPDRSATILYCVSSLLFSEDVSPRVALKGPGIREEIPLGAISGLAPLEMDYLKEINAEFPMGVDAVFIDEGGRILCIPRSTQIRILEH